MKHSTIPDLKSVPLAGSHRMAAVQTPIIPTIGELIKRNPGTISLAQGIVYYDPPQSAIDQIQTFLKDPENHRYGPVQGIEPLLQLISKKLRKDNGIQGDLSDRIIVTAGANMAFLNALFAITDPDDEIILPTPYYFNQEMAIRMVNCQPVLVESNTDFQLDLDHIRNAISSKTRAIVTVSPNNPAGVVYPPQVLKEINQLCAEHDIYHICDEAYEYFTYDQAEHFSPASLASAQEHTISLYSLSKSFGFASWRIGYMLIPQQLYQPIMKAQDTNLICASLIAQFAAVGALQTGSIYCDTKLVAIQETRKLVLQELENISDICSFPASNGAFYFLLKIDTLQDSLTLAKRLIEEYRVAALPGEAFGLTADKGCYLRISYGSLEPHTALEGIQRLTRGLMEICHKNT